MDKWIMVNLTMVKTYTTKQIMVNLYFNYFFIGSWAIINFNIVNLTIVK
jgi:hypothetical protein